MVMEWSDGGRLHAVAIGEANRRHRTPFLPQMLLNNPLLSPTPKPNTRKGLAAILDIKNADKTPILSRLIEERGDAGRSLIQCSHLHQITVFKGRKYDFTNYGKHLKCPFYAVIDPLLRRALFALQKLV